MMLTHTANPNFTLEHALDETEHLARKYGEPIRVHYRKETWIVHPEGIIEKEEQETAAETMLKRVLDAITNGNKSEDTRGVVYTQEFGQAFVDKIKSVLEK